MTATDMTPRWIRELERLTGLRTQIYVHGNIKDTMLYPLGADRTNWTIGPLREALFELYRHQLGGYEIIAAYDSIDGMVFADARDANAMAGLFDELVTQGEKAAQATATKGRAPQAAKPQDQLELAMQQMRYCMLNRQRPCLFIVEYASQLLATPMNLSAHERSSFLRLLKASGESQQISVTKDEQRRTLQNTLIILCDKLADLPTWLYLNNPFAGNIEMGSPSGYERRHFFDLFMPTTDESVPQYEVVDLVDLTDGMTLRDLCGIRTLARRTSESYSHAQGLVDRYKYGVKESEWDNLDIGRLEFAEKLLAERVIGQPAAVNAVADVLRRARLHLSGAQHSSRSKPRGVLFFAGPTGVGKTELAKAIAELVFRTDEACIRFDMSEYSQPQADQRLLGAPPGYVGYEAGGQLTNRVKANPFSVLLFDEIEKAHPSILDKFLQILEDGRMTDGRGETVYFSESIIIFTSNVGIYQLDPHTGRPMVNPVTGQPVLQVDPFVDKEYATVRTKILDGVQNYFKYFLGRPELLNRIGQNIVVFDFIRLEMMRKILERKVLRSIQTQMRERWKMQVTFAPEVSDQMMALLGNDVSSGGRGIGNLAEMAVLNPLARALFTVMGQGGTLAGQTLHVTGIIPPAQAEENRYALAWTLNPTPAGTAGGTGA